MRELLHGWLRARSASDAMAWLEGAKNVAFAFSAASRHFPHEPLALSDDERARLIEIADRCPVHRTLHSEVHVSTKEVSK